MQRRRVIEWKEKLENQVEEKEPLAVKMYARRNKIDVERSSVEGIKRWIYGIKDMIKKVEKIHVEDIRRYFS